MSAQFDRSTG